MAQSWRDLLFAHYRLPADELQVPPPLELDTWDGDAWLTVTPHRIDGIRLRGLPPLPGLSAMREVSARTYVTLHGRPGILFLWLDTDSRVAAVAARRLFRVSYRRTRISLRRAGDRFEFESPSCTATYAAAGGAFAAAASTLDHFLAERRAMYVVDGPRVRAIEFEYEPWRLQEAEADIAVDGLDSSPALLRFSARQDVRFGGPAPTATLGS